MFLYNTANYDAYSTGNYDYNLFKTWACAKDNLEFYLKIYIFNCGFSIKVTFGFIKKKIKMEIDRNWLF